MSTLVLDEELSATRNPPTVSVVMPNYNGAAFLADAVGSARRQSLRNIEIIVADDASTDDSVDIVVQLMKEDPRIRLLTTDRNGGPAAARNRALAVATGEWIAVLDNDDLMHPKRLATLVEAAVRDGADIVADDLLIFESRRVEPPATLLHGDLARGPFWLEVERYIRANVFFGRGPPLGYLKPVFRRSLLVASGARYDERLRVAEDYDFVFRLLSFGARFRVYPLLMYFYRRHGASISHRLTPDAIDAIRTVDRETRKRIDRRDAKLAIALDARSRSIETTWAFVQLVDAVKRRDLGGTARIALRRPQAALLLRLPIAARLKTFFRTARSDARADTGMRAFPAPMTPPPTQAPSAMQQPMRPSSDNLARGERISVVVCICTYRRPQLAAAIESVIAQILPDNIDIRIVVVDNDGNPTAEQLTAELRGRTDIPIEYRHVPGQNISIARNAGLDSAALSDWLAFMDDDEYASSDWLAKLVEARTGVNAVFGPCKAHYAEGAPRWIRGGDYHSCLLVQPEGRPLTLGHTSNALVDMNFVRDKRLRFEIPLGNIGGEDSMFFHTMYRNGGILRYNPYAVVYEDVAPGRMTLAWVAKRKYRSGQTHAMMVQRFDAEGYRRLPWAAGCKVLFCFMASIPMLIRRERAAWWMMRAIYHLGALGYCFGADVFQEYGSGVKVHAKPGSSSS